jgi:hypothetical protein
MTPEEPLPDFPETTSLHEKAVELHEIGKALIDAGFSKREAMYAIGIAIAGGVMDPLDNFSQEYDDNEFDDGGTIIELTFLPDPDLDLDED